MAKIKRFCATVTGFDGESYQFTNKETHESFEIKANDVHMKVIYPSEILDKDGTLKIGSTIHLVQKGVGKQGKTCNFPDTASYTSKDGQQENISSDEYAAHLMNLMDHAHEIDTDTEKNIVQAISHNNVGLACDLIRMALFGNQNK